MIDSARMERSRMVDRYLADELSATESIAFEEYLLEHPETQAEIDAVRRMKLGLATLRERGELDDLVCGRRGISRGPAFALAASVLVAISIGFVLWADRGPTLVAASLDGFAASRHSLPAADVMLVHTRDSVRLHIDRPQEGQLIAFTIPTGRDGGTAPIDVEITREATEEALGVVRGLRESADGELTVYFDARAAGPGDYRVRILPNGDEIVPDGMEDFLITVRP